MFDADLRLTCWNREFREMFELTPDLTRFGVALDEILRNNAERGLYGPGAPDEQVAARLERLTASRTVPRRAGLVGPGDRDPRRAHARRRAGRDLYRRHRPARRRTGAGSRQRDAGAPRARAHRTVHRVNDALARAKGEAEDANVSKTRFLAAAGHDILQPLNAARLYAAAMISARNGAPADEVVGLAQQCGRLAGGGGGYFFRAAGNVAARRRRDEGRAGQFPIDELFRQLGSNSRRWRARRSWS